ncbi:MAG: Hint domain-containing protein [Pseudomonadota bacterium]
MADLVLNGYDTSGLNAFGTPGVTTTIQIEPGFYTTSFAIFGDDDDTFVFYVGEQAASTVPGAADNETRLRVETDYGVQYIEIISFSGTANIVIEDSFICFTAGALVATPDGPRRIETLAPGDIVLTRDQGAQPIAWIGSTTLSAEMLAQFPDRRPIEIAAGAFGAHGATRVSAGHRVMVSGWKAAALFGTDEVLVAARDLVDDVQVRRGPAETVTYVHVMLEAHALIQVDGLWSESLHPGALSSTLGTAHRDEVLELFPGLETAAPQMLARPTVGAADVAMLF